MLVKNPKFVISALRPEQYPVSNLLEVAFSGSTQGMTRQINFYDLDGELMFVDLPGYGYAAVSKDQKALWGKVVEGYLNVRPQLYMVLLLLDVRRDPSADDLLMYRWIREAELEHAVVLTKCDKLSRMKCRERVSEIRRAMSLPSDVNIFPVSSTDRTGLEALWAAIDSAVEEE